jgi:hypothetical protein
MRLPFIFLTGDTKTDFSIDGAAPWQVRCLAASGGELWGAVGSSVVVWGALREDEEVKSAIHKICSSADLGKLTLRMVLQLSLPLPPLPPSLLPFCACAHAGCFKVHTQPRRLETAQGFAAGGLALSLSLSRGSAVGGRVPLARPAL